jgi:hypothetical protein
MEAPVADGIRLPGAEELERHVRFLGVRLQERLPCKRRFGPESLSSAAQPEANPLSTAGADQAKLALTLVSSRERCGGGGALLTPNHGA